MDGLNSSGIIMQLLFLGTSDGKTSTEHFHTSFLISDENTGLLIDTGDGISKAILSAGRKFDDITSIFVTHCHSDHFCGLSSLVTQMILEKRTKPLKIITHKNLEKNIVTLLRISNIFVEEVFFTIELEFIETGKWFSPVKNIEMMIRQNSHIRNKYFEENKIPDDLKFFSASLLFKISEETIFYTSDIGGEKDLYLFREFKIDLMISEIAHINLEQIKKAADILKPKKIILTHIPEMRRKNLENLPGNFILSGDGMKMEI